MVYNYYSFHSNKIERLKENINEKIDLEFEDLNERLDEIENMIEKKIMDCNKKIKDLYSLQNKLNEVNKMNNQSIINQINQYDEAIEDVGCNQNQIFDSIGSSIANKVNTNCFIKMNQIKQNDKEVFYMSPDNKYSNKNSDKNSDKDSDTNADENHLNNNLSKSSKSVNSSDNSLETSESSVSSESLESSEQNEISYTTKSDKSGSSNISEYIENKTNSKDMNKNKKYNESDNDIILEINDVFVKTPYKMENSPKGNIYYDSLNELPNIIKNNSMSKLNSEIEQNLTNEQTSETLSTNNDYELSEKKSLNSNIFIENDPQLLHPEIIKKMNLLNSSRKKNKIIDITP